MNVLLINPSRSSRPQAIAAKGARHIRRWPPLSLLNCAALLAQAGHEVRIIDAPAMPPQAIDGAIRAAAAASDKIFLSSTDIDRWQCPDLDDDYLFKYSELLRNWEICILGAHGTLFPEHLLQQSGARAVIIGEPELTVAELCSDKPLAAIRGIACRQEGALRINPPRPPLDLSVLPPPAYHHVRFEDYHYELLGERFGLLETSRGCPYACTYCWKGMYGPGWRTKPLANVLAEIEALVAGGMETLYFIDLIFTVDRTRVLELCREMALRGYPLQWCCQTRPDLVDAELLAAMKKAGCRLIHYGIESGDDDCLAAIGKQTTVAEIEAGVRLTRDSGIEMAGFFLIGFAGESAPEIETTIAFAKKLNMAYASLHIVSPYPGTKFYAEHYRGGERLPESIFAGPALQALKKTRRRFLLTYYGRPSYLFTHPGIIYGGFTGKRRQLVRELLAPA